MLRRAQPARLLAVDRAASGTRLLLLGRDEAVVGSADGLGLQVADASVGDRHAIIRCARGRYYVSDLKSEGGTFLNGRRIRRTQALKHGDHLRFGCAVPYRFIDPDALRRRSERKILRAIAVIAALVVVGLVDHLEKWNLLSLATVTEIVAWAHPHAISKRIDAPMVRVASAPSRAAASIAVAANAPARGADTPAAMHVAAAAALAPATTPNLSGSAPTSWLARINFYRSGVGLAEIRENSKLSASVAAHARYLLLNFGEDIRATKPIGGAAYDEVPGKSGYTADGANAAPNVQLAWGCSSYDAPAQIDRWFAGPFHRLAMLNPFLTEAAFGEASSGGCWVAAIRLPPPPQEVASYARAIEFPPDGATAALNWIGIESPDPLASCPGYERPAGLPITIQLGRLVETRLSAHSLIEDGKPIEHCAFDAQSYLNQDSTAQEYGRWNLRSSSAVVVIPRAPLRHGSHYAVAITANDKTYAWDFTAAKTQATTFTAIAKFPVSATPVPTARPATEPRKAASPRPPRTARSSHRATPEPAAPAIAPMSRASAMPTSSPPSEAPSTTSSSTSWLTVLNAYRTRLHMPSVTEDPALSRGDLAHAKYLVMNYRETFASLGSLMHEEDESKPGYSPEGRKAAHSSDVKFQTRTNITDTQRMAIEWWISAPFHRPSLVNPDLRQVGFGEYCERTLCVAVLNCISDLPLASPGGRPLAQPVEVPPDGVTVKSGGFGGEWPDPVSSCTGYTTNSAAITLQLGMHVSAKITDASVTQTTGAAAGTKVETCAYDSEGYTNPDPLTQTRGRQILDSFGEVIMIVRDPLASGQTYRVSMTVNGKPYDWTFSTLP